MNGRNNKQKMKPGAVLAIFIAVIGFSLVGEDSPVAEILGMLILIIGIVGWAVSAIIRKAASAASEDKDYSEYPKKTAKGEHNHDRLSSPNTKESMQDHWRIQLDGFLKAGIIDRDEYKVLMRKHMKEFNENNRNLH